MVVVPHALCTGSLDLRFIFSRSSSMRFNLNYVPLLASVDAFLVGFVW